MTSALLLAKISASNLQLINFINKIKYSYLEYYYSKLQIKLFCISPKEVSFVNLPHSSFSSPARYLMELFVRLRSSESRSDAVLLFNPFFVFDMGLVRNVKKEIDKQSNHSEIIILSDILMNVGCRTLKAINLFPESCHIRK